MPGKEIYFIIGNLCMLLAAIFWGLNISVTKALIPEWMTPESIACVRLVGGCALFWITCLFIKNDPIAREDWIKVLIGGVVGLFGLIYLFILALKYGSAIDISIIMTLPPMFVILLEVIFVHRRPTLMEYVGIVVSFAGAVIVILAGSANTESAPNKVLGDSIAMVSCVCYAIYLVILQKPSHKYKPASLLRWVFLCGAVPAFVFLPGMIDLPIVHTSKIAPWAEIIFILIGPTYLAYFLTQPAVKFIGSELTSLYQYLIPVFAAISAVIMGLESIKSSQVIAMAVIIAGMVITNLGKKKRVEKGQK